MDCKIFLVEILQIKSWWSKWILMWLDSFRAEKCPLTKQRGARVIPLQSLERKYLRMRRVLSFLNCTQEKWSRIHKNCKRICFLSKDYKVFLKGYNYWSIILMESNKCKDKNRSGWSGYSVRAIFSHYWLIFMEYKTTNIQLRKLRNTITMKNFKSRFIFWKDHIWILCKTFSNL